MKIEIEKIEELEYNEMIVLSIIESDEDLITIFREVTLLSFDVLRRSSEQGKLSNEIRATIVGIFDSIICTKLEYVKTYNKYLVCGVEVSTPLVGEIGVVLAPPSKPKKKKKVNEKALPKWYGREKVLADIEREGGKATPVQRASLSVNDLKNLYVKLNNRLIKDMLLDTQILSDEDYRTITSTIVMMKNKLEPIFKKK